MRGPVWPGVMVEVLEAVEPGGRRFVRTRSARLQCGVRRFLSSAGVGAGGRRGECLASQAFSTAAMNSDPPSAPFEGGRRAALGLEAFGAAAPSLTSVGRGASGRRAPAGEPCASVDIVLVGGRRGKQGCPKGSWPLMVASMAVRRTITVSLPPVPQASTAEILTSGHQGDAGVVVQAALRHPRENEPDLGGRGGRPWACAGRTAR